MHELRPLWEWRSNLLPDPIESAALIQRLAKEVISLRAHCQRQRKELKRLNASNARIVAGRNARRLDDYLRLQVTGLVTLRGRVEELEKSTERVARFVGAVPVNGGAK